MLQSVTFMTLICENAQLIEILSLQSNNEIATGHGYCYLLITHVDSICKTSDCRAVRHFSHHREGCYGNL